MNWFCAWVRPAWVRQGFSSGAALALLSGLAAWLVAGGAALAPAPAAAQIAGLRAGLGTSGAAVVTTPQVRAELLAVAPQGVGPGKPLWAALQLTHQPHWHTYWLNPGDSGQSTELQWTLPQGVSAGAVAWPVPQKIWIGRLANYGYEGTVLLPVPLTVARDFAASTDGQLDLRLHASWLVCRRECIPEEGDFHLRIPVGGSMALHQGALDAALAQVPATQSGNNVQAKVQGDTLALTISGLPAAWRGRTLQGFPEVAEVLENGVVLPGAPEPDAARKAPRWQQAWQGNAWTAQWPLSPQRAAAPAQLPLVLAVADAPASAPVRVVAAVSGPLGQGAAAWPALPAPPLSPASPGNASNGTSAVPGSAAAGNTGAVAGAVAGAGAGNLGAGAAAAVGVGAAAGSAGSAATPALDGLLPALLAAVLGGLILNLMPCVFPVLAIKLLALVRHADARERLAHGWAYAAGVVLSFVALGALLFALRAGGAALGWGFQLQSPWVVVALAVLFTLLGLNLMGVFELGQVVPSAWAGLQLRHPLADAFFSGVLAVAIASPCTAPFMGASLGYAAALPPWQALWIFAALGVGMALPYVVVGMVPALARWLPQPGAWMAVFRHAMAFPMFASVVWLVWVLGQQSGIDGVAVLLALLLVLTMTVWSLGLSGPAKGLLATVSVAMGGVLIAVAGHLMGKTDAVPVVSDASVATPGAAGTPATAPGSWLPWRPNLPEQLLAQGQPVFVDFTAAWCVTCQYNKQTTLADAAVLADFAAHKVQLLRADWTRHDPAITAALQALGRSGVPVYVLLAPGRAPKVFSEILSAADLRAALAAL